MRNGGLVQSQPRFDIERIDHILKIQFNQNDGLNTLNQLTLSQLEECIRDLENDDEVHGVIITGKGPVFVSGFDVKEVSQFDKKQAKEFSKLGQDLLCLIETIKEPVIAAVNGACLGVGCDLAMACDFIFSSENAKFGFPEINLGVIPCFGATSRLTKKIGITKAKDLVMTGRIISAQEAVHYGLINQVIQNDSVLEEATKFLNNLLKKPKITLALAKDAVIRGLELEIPTANEIESDYFSWCFETQDQKEGMKAYLEKRIPNFS